MPHNSQLNIQRNRSIRLLASLVAILFTLSPIQASAFNANDNEPIKIQSDRAELDEQKGRSVYSGDVIITQGTSTLRSDKVIIYNDNSGLIKLEAFGTPAHFTQQQEADAQPTHAYGNTIIYTRADEKLTLIKDAKLEQGKNTFRGETIEYNTLSRVVTAQGGKEESERVEIIVHPIVKPTEKGSGEKQE